MIICNKCKIIIKGEYSQMNLPKGFGWDPLNTDRIWDSVHLCPKCAEQVYKWIEDNADKT